jgi:hypothetical protein
VALSGEYGNKNSGFLKVYELLDRLRDVHNLLCCNLGRLAPYVCFVYKCSALLADTRGMFISV